MPSLRMRKYFRILLNYKPDVNSYLVMVWLLFGASIPICSFIFFYVFLLLVSVVFSWGGERYEWCLDGLVVWGR